ncbi:MAG: DUF1631 domain-containing protein [Methylococcaceae bacterium]|nr:DUF1631 domain-containing protein [Methylococcaceae bacterium]
MATSSCNVVPFDSIQQKREALRKPGEIQMINECRSLVADHLNRLLQGLFLRTDDELFKLSDKAESSTVQSMYFDAMRYVRKEKENLQNLCVQAFFEQYDDYWQSAKRGRIQQPQREQQPSSLDDFALVENETLEEDLAVNSMIQKGNNLFHAELFALGKRFGVLRNGSEESPEEIPVDPAALCRSFEKAIKPQTIELKVKLLIYKLFDGLVLSQCGPMYQDINSYLADQGILPTIAKRVRRSGSAAYPSGESGFGGETDSTEATYLEAFQSMQSLLDGWRSHLGLPTQAALTPGAVYVNAGEVINALSLLQQPNLLPSTVGGDGEGSADALKAYLLSQLGKLSPDGQNRTVGRSEEDIIDMVAMLFDFILDDRNLCDPVKALIARLQIPVVKVAIIDKSFFSKKNHPARVLLNQLAQAGVGLDIADSSSENPVFRKIEEIVGHILHDFDQDIGYFSSLQEDFTAFLEKDVQRSQLAEDRTRQTTQSKEQLNLAKRKVAYEISVRLTGKTVPTAAQSFLFNAWKDVLVLAYLRKERDPSDWRNALSTMDQLIRSVIPPTDAAGRQELVQSIPPMLRTIRGSLDAISFDPHQTEELLKDLESCHLICLKVTPGAEHQLQREQADVSIKDPELAEAIREVRCNLPDIDDISVEEMELNGMAEEIVLESLQPRSGIGVDAYFEKASAMRVGEWIEFTDEYKNASRAKLSWKSQVTGLYVFVNRKGVKVAEMKVNDLATRLRLGAARIIEGTTVPLMDRALSALMQTLKTPAQQAQPAS